MKETTAPYRYYAVKNTDSLTPPPPNSLDAVSRLMDMYGYFHLFRELCIKSYVPLVSPQVYTYLHIP